MSERETFLVRWARRKREAAEVRPEPVPEEPAPAPTDRENLPEPAAASTATETQGQRETSLPPIDSIDGGTDIRPFLGNRVSEDLARAALRRAWSKDPAIRDFVGLSENSWDFNAPGGVPGFGTYASDLAQSLVSQVLGPAGPDDGHKPKDQELDVSGGGVCTPKLRYAALQPEDPPPPVPDPTPKSSSQ